MQGISRYLCFLVPVALLVYMVIDWMQYPLRQVSIPLTIYVGVIMLALSFVMMYRNTRKGVLVFTAVLILGIMGRVSFSPARVSVQLSVGDAGLSMGDYWLLLFFFAHIIICFRHFIGILQASYWQDVLGKKKDHD